MNRQAQDMDTLEPEVSETLPVRRAPSGDFVDIQVATAREYPRSLTAFRKDLLTEATLDEDTAASMIYGLPRDGKVIEGPSARFAEAAAYAWGNLRAQGDVEGEDESGQFVVARGICWDLEKNVAIGVRVKRRITNRDGKKYNADMVGTTSMAAVSVALRNSVLKVIPKSQWKPAYEAARLASLGKGNTVEQNRQNAIAWFGKLGITPERICAALNVAGVEEIGVEQLITLKGLQTAIKDGELSAERAFGREGSEPGQATSLNEKLRERQAAGGTTPERPQAQPAPAPEETATDAEQPEVSEGQAILAAEAHYKELMAARHPDWNDENIAGWEKLMIKRRPRTVEDFEKLTERLSKGAEGK